MIFVKYRIAFPEVRYDFAWSGTNADFILISGGPCSINTSIEMIFTYTVTTETNLFTLLTPFVNNTIA